MTTYFKFTIRKITIKAGNPGNTFDRKYIWIPIFRILDYDWKQGIGFYCGNFAFEIHTEKASKAPYRS